MRPCSAGARKITIAGSSLLESALPVSRWWEHTSFGLGAQTGRESRSRPYLCPDASVCGVEEAALERGTLRGAHQPRFPSASAAALGKP